MSRRTVGSVPSFVHHTTSNRARVRINGRDYWLGKWGSPEAQLAYDRLITEFLATRRVVSHANAVTATVSPASVRVAIDPAFLQVADNEQIKDSPVNGTSTSVGRTLSRPGPEVGHSGWKVCPSRQSTPQPP